MSDQQTEDFAPFQLPEVPAQPTATDGITSHDARLIWDLVSNIRPRKEILDSYGLTLADLAAKARNELWAGAYREAERVWKSDMNAKTRIQLKAQFLLEDSLPTLFNIIRQEGVSINAKLEAIEQLTKISTVTNVPKENAVMEKHNITINIGGESKPITIVAEVPSVGSSLSPAG
jgi:hypothetical protein